jgi:hypothetical protein
MSEWIRVEDRLPEVGHWYVCYSMDQSEILFFDSACPVIWLQHGDWGFRVTHWMPLPEPPCDTNEQ